MNTIKPILLFFENIMKNIPTFCLIMFATIGFLSYEKPVDFNEIPGLIINISIIFVVIGILLQLFITGFNLETITFTITTWLSTGLLVSILFDYSYNPTEQILNPYIILWTMVFCMIVGKLLQIIIATLTSRGVIESNLYEIHFVTTSKDQFEEVRELLNEVKNEDLED